MSSTPSRDHMIPSRNQVMLWGYRVSRSGSGGISHDDNDNDTYPVHDSIRPSRLTAALGPKTGTFCPKKTKKRCLDTKSNNFAALNNREVVGGNIHGGGGVTSVGGDTHGGSNTKGGTIWGKICGGNMGVCVTDQSLNHLEQFSPFPKAGKCQN